MAETLHEHAGGDAALHRRPGSLWSQDAVGIGDVLPSSELPASELPASE